jgi:hypothetical protein
LPLSKPIVLDTGEEIDSLPVPKGTKIFASIAAYNRYARVLSRKTSGLMKHLRNKDIFGEDADVFNPERWLREKSEKKGPGVGVYANL